MPAWTRLAPAEGRHIWFLGNLMTIKVGAGDDEHMSVVEATMCPGHAPPLHVHADEDEAFYVLEGRIRFRCGEQDFEAGPGEFVHVPRGVPHAFRAGEGVRALMIATSGALAGFMQAVGTLAPERVMPPSADVDAAELAATASSYGMTILGPPLS